jgi:peptide subunit release factor 1 (eRF1)
MLNEILAKLVALESTPLPFLSAYIDLTPELKGSHQSERNREDLPPLKSWRREEAENPQTRLYRQGTTLMRDLLHEKGRLFDVRGAERESYDADAERILAYLEGEFDSSMHGLAIFACHGADVWEVVEIPVPIETRLIVDRMPFISPLAYVEDAYDRYALCLADSQTARVYVVGLGRAEREETIEGPSINYQMTGGWSQKRIQERIKNAVSNHIREVVQLLEQIVFAEDIPHIILSGDEIVQTEFRKHLSKRAMERVVERNRLATKLPAQEAILQTMQTILEAEQSDARDIARQAIDATLADGLGAAGAEAVVQALRIGAVSTLVLDAAFQGEGWRSVEDPTQIGEGGQPKQSPIGYGAAEKSDLREDLVTLALKTGAAVEFVEGSDVLARAGGVAALLRWHPGDLPNRVAEPQETPTRAETDVSGVV